MALAEQTGLRSGAANAAPKLTQRCGHTERGDVGDQLPGVGGVGRLLALTARTGVLDMIEEPDLAALVGGRATRKGADVTLQNIVSSGVLRSVSLRLQRAIDWWGHRWG